MDWEMRRFNWPPNKIPSVQPRTSSSGAEHKQSRLTVPLLDAVVLNCSLPNKNLSVQTDTLSPGGEHKLGA